MKQAPNAINCSYREKQDAVIKKTAGIGDTGRNDQMPRTKKKELIV